MPSQVQPDSRLDRSVVLPLGKVYSGYDADPCLVEDAMNDDFSRLDDGESYELMMGRWSVLVGAQFLDWIGVPDTARWLDVGCGSGAFTQLLVERCKPAYIRAFDTSEQQLAYARTRLPASAPVTWAEGDAMRLPVLEASFDAAVMALVLFFVPEPALGVAQMCRAVRPGGVVAAYHWDVMGGGFPLVDIMDEMRKLGVPPRMPPSLEASTIDTSTELWRAAGLDRVRTCQISVQRAFESFDEFWASAQPSKSLRPMFEDMDRERRRVLKENVRRRLGIGAGPMRVSARANAICGVKPC